MKHFLTTFKMLSEYAEDRERSATGPRKVSEKYVGAKECIMIIRLTINGQILTP